MVEEGITEMDDILRERVGSLRFDRERAHAALGRVRAHMMPSQSIPPEIVEQFDRAMRKNIRAGDVPFRKAYLRSVIDRVEVDDAPLPPVREAEPEAEEIDELEVDPADPVRRAA